MPAPDRNALPPMEVSSRLGRLRERLPDAGCDALLVTAIENVRYLTGFTGSSAMLFVTAKGALLVTDGRYEEQANLQLGAAGVQADVGIGRAPEQIELLDFAAKGIGRLGLEADSVSWGRQRQLESGLERLASSGGSLVPTSNLVETLRIVKDAGELARIELAADIADVSLAQVKSRLAEGVSEVDFATELDFEMRRRGADGPSFETIVASGPNASRPHARPSRRQIEEGDVIIVDFGALVDGYHSDMTRTLVPGGVREGELTDVLDAVLASQRAGVRALKAGVTGGEVDETCRRSLREAGYGDRFVHGTGHGVGLQVHEAPAVAVGSTDILVEGSVVTVEPGAYLPGIGGVRIEDTLVVTLKGARALTKSTKDTSL